MMPAMLRKLRQEDHEFHASLVYIQRDSIKKKGLEGGSKEEKQGEGERKVKKKEIKVPLPSCNYKVE